PLQACAEIERTAGVVEAPAEADAAAAILGERGIDDRVGLVLAEDRARHLVEAAAPRRRRDDLEPASALAHLGIGRRDERALRRGHDLLERIERRAGHLGAPRRLTMLVCVAMAPETIAKRRSRAVHPAADGQASRTRSSGSRAARHTRMRESRR